ncbi:NAD(P)/FAD-dependent oxidoreductase [Geomicrobium sp. JCM 19038]|uniref:phytoene desaturase family protein n=1 Tax=Geomicrobium sp. JCM 19038 TaxID=1460635 RepID=UPI00045F23F9|nr:hypothetical protein [Geomicrobium sp. JCM 19038]GAK09246.1 phytoene desaturase, neurosporene or lycopene producing [Geomicrobium sp. JCM 19038]
MEQVLTKLGVTIKTETKVTKIVNEKDLVTGVELATGQTIKSDYVVSNREVVSTYADLLPEHTNKPLVHKYEPTVSGLVMLLGINRDYEQLAHHNFFFSKDPELEFKQIYEENVQPMIRPCTLASLQKVTQHKHQKEKRTFSFSHTCLH